MLLALPAVVPVQRRGRPPKKRMPLQDVSPLPESASATVLQATSCSEEPLVQKNGDCPESSVQLPFESAETTQAEQNKEGDGNEMPDSIATVEKGVLPDNNAEIDEDATLSAPCEPPVVPQELSWSADGGRGAQEVTNTVLRPTAPSSPAKHRISSSTNPPAMVAGTSRVNVSHLRRENEVVRLLENAGGIFNIQTKEFYENHTKLLESLAQAGESTSSPAGTRIDKRTATATINSLENKGRIKILKTSITSSTGINRPACIIYYPHIEQSKLNNFLTELAQMSQHTASQLTQFVKIDKRLEYGVHSPSTCRGIVPIQLLQMEHSRENDGEKWAKNPDRATELFGYNESTIREVLLTERTTMAQFYGFIVGKALRCRQLHLSTVRALELVDTSPYIISHDKRIIDLSFFCQDISLELYCSLISPLTYDEELTSILNTVEGRQTLLRDLPQSLQSSLQLGRSRARSRLLDMLEMLRSLELITPLQPSVSDTPFITCSLNGQHPTEFDLAPLEGWTASTPTIAPTYWHVHASAPIRLWVTSENRPPLWKTMSVITHGDALAYWNDLREACNNSKFVSNGQYFSEASPLSASVSAARSLRRTASWRTEYFLSWHQMQYLKQFIDAVSFSTPLQLSDDQERDTLLSKICWVTSARRETVERYFSTARGKWVRAAEKIKNKAKRLQKRAEESKLSLAKKAEEARLQREQEWSTLLRNVHPEPLPSNVAVRIERIRGQFLQAGCVSDHTKWHRDIRAALREAELATSKGLKIQYKRAPLYRRPPTQSSAMHMPSSEVSIQELIELQGPPEQYASVPVRRKRKKEDDGGMTIHVM